MLMNINKKILEIRKNNNLTQEEFAEMLNVTRQTVSNWENLKCYPDIETIIIISQKFNISLDNLLKGDMVMIKDVDKRVKNNKKLKVIVFVFIFISILLSFFVYNNKIKLVKAEELNKIFLTIPDGYIVYNLDIDKLINYNINANGDIDIYVVNEEMDKTIISKPLIYNAKLLRLKDKDGKDVNDVEKTKYVLVGLPNECSHLLHLLEYYNNSLLVVKSKDNSYTGINLTIKEYIYNFYSKELSN